MIESHNSILTLHFITFVVIPKLVNNQKDPNSTHRKNHLMVGTLPKYIGNKQQVSNVV